MPDSRASAASRSHPPRSSKITDTCPHHPHRPAQSLGGHESFQDWLSNSSTASQSSGGLHVGPGQPQHATQQGGTPPASSNAAVQSWLKRPPSSAGSAPRWSGDALPLPMSGPSARPSDGRDSLASSAARLSSSRVSVASSADTAASGYSLAGKGRVSYALERASLESNRGMLDMFASNAELSATVEAAGPSSAGEAAGQAPAPGPPCLANLTAAWGLAGAHAERCARLAVFAPHAPAPLSVLEKLWETGTGDASATVSAMAVSGVVSVAQAPDGMLWCLPQLDCLLSLQVGLWRDGWHAWDGCLDEGGPWGLVHWVWVWVAGAWHRARGKGGPAGGVLRSGVSRKAVAKPRLRAELRPGIRLHPFLHTVAVCRVP